MKSTKVLISVVAATICLLLITLLLHTRILSQVNQLIHNSESIAANQPDMAIEPGRDRVEPTTQLFRLKIDRERGDELRLSAVEIVTIPSRFADAFGDDVIPIENGAPLGGYDRVFQYDVLQGQFLTHRMFSRSARSTIAANIEAGHRLFTIKVDTRNQPANLEPGDYIDLYAYFSGRRGTVATLVMERVEVHAVGNRGILSGDGASTSRQNTYSNISIQIPVELVAPMMTIQTLSADEEFNIAVRHAHDYASAVEGTELGQINPDVLGKLGLELQRAEPNPPIVFYENADDILDLLQIMPPRRDSVLIIYDRNITSARSAYDRNPRDNYGCYEHYRQAMLHMPDGEDSLIAEDMMRYSEAEQVLAEQIYDYYRRAYELWRNDQNAEAVRTLDELQRLFSQKPGRDTPIATAIARLRQLADSER